MLSKKSLAVRLSRMKPFEKPKEHLEQYPTDSEVAADLLHHALMIDGFENKKVLDLGAGTGMLGIGCLLLGAVHVTFLDIDADALKTLNENLQEADIEEGYELRHSALQALPADVVVMNPPFGTRAAHADRAFLEAAMQSAPTIYSLHNAGSERFITALASDNGFEVTHRWEYQMPLKQTLHHHRRKIERVPVVAVRMEKAKRQPL